MSLGLTLVPAENVAVGIHRLGVIFQALVLRMCPWFMLMEMVTLNMPTCQLTQEGKGLGVKGAKVYFILILKFGILYVHGNFITVYLIGTVTMAPLRLVKIVYLHRQNHLHHHRSPHQPQQIWQPEARRRQLLI